MHPQEGNMVIQTNQNGVLLMCVLRKITYRDDDVTKNGVVRCCF